MDLLNNNATAEILADDVLVEVFSYLEGDELLPLESVCYRWHRVITDLINWKRICERKLQSSRTWRQVFTCLSATAPSYSNPKGLYRQISRKIQEMDGNWRTGKFSERDIEIDLERSSDADDEFLLNIQSGGAVVYDRKRLKILHKISGGFIWRSSMIKDGLLFLTENRNKFIIFDVRTGNKIAELDEFEQSFISDIIYTPGALVITGRGWNFSSSVFQLWRKTAQGFDFVCQRTYGYENIRVDVDELYIAIFLGNREYGRQASGRFNIFFLSDTNADRSFGVRNKNTAFLYDQGIFFLLSKNGIIRLMDVSTGRWMCSMRHPRWRKFYDLDNYLHWKPIAVNSKYMATLDEDRGQMADSTIRIFDFVAAKNPRANCNNLLLCTIHVPGFQFCSFQMNETEIYGIGENHRYDGREYFKSLNFSAPASGHEVIGSITKRGRIVRKPARLGQAKLRKRN